MGKITQTLSSYSKNLQALNNKKPVNSKLFGCVSGIFATKLFHSIKAPVEKP
jgi:hypothetical protein